MSSTLATGGSGRPAQHVDRRTPHLVLRLATERPTEFIDITDRLDAFVDRSGIVAGVMAVQSLHTTVGITVNEYEPLLLQDLARHLEGWAPRDACYAHDDTARRLLPHPAEQERLNGHAHCRTLLVGGSVCLGVADGRLLLGRWQRVIVVELDGPQVRQVVATLAGHAA